MSSRLFQEIREKRGLAYAVYSFLSLYEDAGLLGIYVGTDPREVSRVLRTLKREIVKIQRGEISKADLEATQEPLVGEDLYAIGAYMNASPTHVASLRTQDIFRWVIIGLILVGSGLKFLGLI